MRALLSTRTGFIVRVLVCLAGAVGASLSHAGEDVYGRVPDDASTQRFAALVAYTTVLGRARRASGNPWLIWERNEISDSILRYHLGQAKATANDRPPEEIFDSVFSLTVGVSQRSHLNFESRGSFSLLNAEKLEKIYGNFQDPHLKEVWRAVIMDAEAKLRSHYPSKGSESWFGWIWGTLL